MSFVYDTSSILKLINLFNGNLCLTHKINQLSNWVKHFPNREMNILLNYKNNQICLLNGWLSGFIDAEGCFNVIIIKRSQSKLGFRTK